MVDLLELYGKVCLMVHAAGADKDLQGWQHLLPLCEV